MVVGASHASRLGVTLAKAGAKVIQLCEPGWRVTKTRVAALSEKLKVALDAVGEDCTVVYQMLDNSVYFAKTEEGGLVPICKRVDKYHVDGELYTPSFAQPNLLLRWLARCGKLWSLLSLGIYIF